PELTDKVKVRLGAVLLAKGDPKAALGHLLPVARNPRSAMAAHATYCAGECALQQGDLDEAVKRLSLFRDRGAFQTVPGVTHRALLRWGDALAQLKQWDASRQAYEQVVNRFGNGPWVPQARYGIGRAFQNLGQHDNAVNTYTQVVQTDGSERGARAQLGIGQ